MEHNSARKTFIKFIDLARPYFLWYALLCLLSFLVSSLEIVRTEAFRRIVNGVVGMSADLLREGFIIGLTASILLPVLTFINTYFGEILNLISTKKLQLNIFERVLKMRTADFKSYHSGDLIYRVNNSAAEMQRGINVNTREILEMILKIVLSITYLSLINLRLTIGCILILTGIPGFTNFLSSYLRKAFQNSIMLNTEIDSYVQDIVQASEVVRTYSLEKRSFSQLESLYKRFLKWVKRRLFYLLLLIRSKFLVMMGGLLFIYGYGGLLAFNGSIDVGSLVAFSFLFMRVSEPVNQLISIWPSLQGSLAHGSRIFELMDKKEESGYTEIVNLDNKELRLIDLKFGYAEDDDVLQGVYFTINPNEITVLVGPSGSGKTTILELISGNYQLKSGDIVVGDSSISSLSLNYWRQKVSYLTQQPFIFSGTIFENIRYGNLSSTAEEVYEAAKVANIHSFITSLPEGYETVIGDGKIEFSGGQKQRIAIARAFIKNPQILLLDEPYSFLDTENAALVQDALAKLIKNKTVLISTHNLQLIKKADKILLLKDGRIEEIDHDQKIGFLNGVKMDEYKTGY